MQEVDEAMLFDKKWHSNNIRSNAKKTMLFMWGFGIVWLLISSPPIIANVDDLLRSGDALKWGVAILFPAVGLFILYQAMKKTMEWQRFGATPLSLSPFPGSIGGEVGGTITLSQPLPKGTEFEVVLSNVYTYVSGSGKNRSTRNDILWQECQRVIPQTDLDGSAISFKFAVPSSLHGSQPYDSNGHYHWTVLVESQNPNLKLARNYDIPVFQLDTAQRSEVETNIIDEGKPEFKNVQSTATLDGLELNYPMFSNLGFSLPITLIGSLFAGIGFFMMFGDMGAPMFMGIIFALIGSLFAVVGFAMLGNAYKVKVDMQGVHMDRQWFMKKWKVHFPIDQIKEIRKKKSGSSQSGGRMEQFFKLELVDQSGRTTTIGDNISGTQRADLLIEQIEAALNGAIAPDFD